MIAVECPQCGAATPAFPLAPEHVRCRACRYQGPPRPEVVAQIRAAAAHLGAAHAHHARQIGAAQARVLRSLLRNRSALHTVLILLLLPLGTCAGCTCIGLRGEDPQFSLAMLFALPLIFFAAGATFVSRRLGDQVRELSDACGAVPPGAAGEPAQCHLCGAGLPAATTAQPIVRCRHCAADNVASPEVLRDAVSRRHLVVGHFEQSLARRGAALAHQGAGAVALVAVLGIAAPFLGCVSSFVLDSQLQNLPLEPLPAEYVLVDTGAATCIALLRGVNPDGSFRLDASGLGGAASTRPPPDASRFSPTWFEGQWLRTGTAPTSPKGVARSVYVHLLRPRRNQVELVDEKGTTSRHTLDGSCFLVPPPGARTVAWVVPTTSAPAGPTPSSTTGGRGSRR